MNEDLSLAERLKIFSSIQMLIEMMMTKIHGATVKQANLNYRGSITIDKNLMDAAELLEYQKVHVLNINNGQRFETYVIEGEAGTGNICINGAAARLAHPGDSTIIIAYAMMERDQAESYKPRIIMVDKNNNIVD